MNSYNQVIICIARILIPIFMNSYSQAVICIASIQYFKRGPYINKWILTFFMTLLRTYNRHSFYTFWKTYANIFTKDLRVDLFSTFCSKLDMTCIYASIEGNAEG